MTADEIDAAFRVIGTFTDLKSYWLRGHAEGTSQLAEAAAWRLGLPPDDVTVVRRAALALDLGRVAVSNAIWEKPGPFGLNDWERVQLHPYFTERSFAHAVGLASIGELAGAHHERLDGACYHRKTPAPGLDRAARISPPPTRTRRCESGARTDRRSTLPRPRPSCCATRARAVCARRRSTPCWPRPDTVWRNGHASCPRG
jgi:hypothetical protein